MAIKSFYAGNTIDLTTPVTDEAGAAVDLTGMTAATYRLADSIDATTHLIEKTLGAGVSSSGSTATVRLDKTDTTAMAGVFFHELKITDAAGFESTIFSEMVEILETLID